MKKLIWQMLCNAILVSCTKPSREIFQSLGIPEGSSATTRTFGYNQAHGANGIYTPSESVNHLVTPPPLLSMCI